MIAVASAPSHRAHRDAARGSWLRRARGKPVAVAFMLGATEDAALEDSLRQEQDQWGDLVRADFLDAYANLTLKSVAIVAWADQHCPQARYVMKVGLVGVTPGHQATCSHRAIAVRMKLNIEPTGNIRF